MNVLGCDSIGEDPAAEAFVCGDGNINGSEACDDGNAFSGDGCSSTCTVETANYPQSCLELQQTIVAETGARPADGTYTLYVGNDKNKPWDAFCFHMNLASPLEYLSVSEDLNYSQAGDGRFVAVTTYRRFRINPTTLEIDPLDDTFASSEGFDSFTPELPTDFTNIPAGWAQFQPTRSDDGPAAEANASFSGTPFAFSETILANSLSDFFCTVTTGGDPADGEGTAEVSADLTAFHLTAINSNQGNAPSGIITREVADCENLGPSSTFTTASWPLQYVGSEN